MCAFIRQTMRGILESQKIYKLSLQLWSEEMFSFLAYTSMHTHTHKHMHMHTHRLPAHTRIPTYLSLPPQKSDKGVFAVSQPAGPFHNSYMSSVYLGRYVSLCMACFPMVFYQMCVCVWACPDSQCIKMQSAVHYTQMFHFNQWNNRNTF